MNAITKQRLCKALTEERIDRLETDKLISFLSKLLPQTYILVGFKLPMADDLTLITGKLCSDLLESFSFLTFGEVALCFELGAKGEYGDFIGLNIRTFIHWLKAYKTSDLRYRAIVVNKQIQQQASLPEISKAYRQEHEDRFLQRVFDQYRNRYPLERLYPARVYQLLQARGILADSLSDKKEAMSRFAKWKPANGLHMNEEMRLYLVKSQAMQWLLQRFFDNLIRIGTSKLLL